MLAPRTLRVLLAVSLVLASGCSTSDSKDDSDPSDDKGSGGASSCEVDFSPSDDLRLDELTQAQAVAVCHEYSSVLACAYPESVACRFEGIAMARADGSDDPDVCRAVEAQCLAEGSKSAEESSECDDTAPIEYCEATISDLQQCWQEVVDYAFTEARDWTCDDVTAYFAWVDSGGDIASAACDRVNDCN